MSIQEKVLLLLEENKNKALSGEEIASRLGCTRAAIWKAIKSLKSNGYEIEAVNNKGYTLKVSADILSEAYIKEQVADITKSTLIKVEKVVDSTNNILKNLANSGMYDDMILIAEEQTAGRGRRGRSFYSPKDSGVYISFLLHPNIPVSEASMLTTLAVTAEALAIEAVSGMDVSIKWVNDLYMRNKKISGILTEASTSIEDGSLEYAVVGIGINIYEPENGFPEEIKDLAGSIFTDNIARENLKNQLVSSFITNFMKFYNEKTELNKISRSYIKEYEKRCTAIGKNITILTPDHKPVQNNSTAYVIGINENCNLIVRYEDGSEAILSNGEISIRL